MWTTGIQYYLVKRIVFTSVAMNICIIHTIQGKDGYMYGTDNCTTLICKIFA